MRRDGYLHLRGVLCPTEVETIRAECRVPPGRPFYTLSGKQDALYTKRAREIVEGLFGRKLARVGPTLVPKRPHEPARGWHHDFANYEHPRATSDEPLLVGVLFYPEGTGGALGGELRVVRASHVRWTRAHEVLEERFGDSYLHGGREPGADFETRDMVSLACDPSDVVLIDARTLHSSAPWRGDHDRLGVNIWCWFEPLLEEGIQQPYVLREQAREKAACPQP